MKEKGSPLGLAKRLKESRVKTEFYPSLIGKKASAKMSWFVFIVGQIGLQKAQAHQTELRRMLEVQQGK